MVEQLLVGTDLTVSYGAFTAVNGLSLTVGAGEIVGLIGPNGAGKTSVIDGITGFTRMTGRLELRGGDILGTPPHQRRRRGLSRTWQTVGMFDDLTVTENVVIASTTGGRSTSGQTDAFALLARLGIDHLSDRLPSALSHGQRVLVGLARALGGGPSVVLLDEPAAGLDDAEGRDLATVIKELAADGLGILLVDHDMSLVMDVCDRIYVIDFGELKAVGTPAEVVQDPAVIAAYLGQPAGAHAKEHS